MKKICLCVLPLILLLAAYSAASVAGETKRTTDPETIRDCTGDPRAPMVMFDLDTMTADPLCVRARLGTTIVIRLIPQRDLKDVSVRIDPKNEFKDSWLQGRNHPFDDVVFIRVPGTYDLEKTGERDRSHHDYVVVARFSLEGKDEKIDPRIEVEH